MTQSTRPNVVTCVGSCQNAANVRFVVSITIWIAICNQGGVFSVLKLNGETQSIVAVYTFTRRIVARVGIAVITNVRSAT